MQEQVLTAQEARQNWRQLTVRAMSGKITIVTHYGDEVGAFVPIDQYRRMKVALEALQAEGQVEREA